MKNRQNDYFFIGLILLSLFLFFPELFLMKKGFFSGDHRAQHYPWAAFLSEQIKHFRLPWWTKSFHCGFPLLAEGQVGGLYPPNLLFSFLFPLRFAYTYGILFHYFLGGVLLYAYLRSLKLSTWSSFFGTLIYLFGTSQGGYFYNIISLKVLIWLPLTFYLMDRILERGEKWVAFWLALVWAFQWCGGYLQYAVYSIGFSLFYFLWFSIFHYRKTNDKKLFLSHMGIMAGTFLLSMLLASPQLLSTFELARFSNRFSYTEEFAYVGSLNPLAVSTLIFPHWDEFLGRDIYVGGFGLFFLAVSLFKKKSAKEFFFFGMAVLALAVSLGKYDPLFVGLIKATHFYGFRTPTKCIFFCAFSLCVLAAYGYEAWMQKEGMAVKTKEKSIMIFSWISGLTVAGLVLSNWVLNGFSGPIKNLLRDHITESFANSAVHTKPLVYYFGQLDIVYGRVLQIIRIMDPWNLMFLGMLVVPVLVLKIAASKFRQNLQRLHVLVLGILFLNLFIYGYVSIKGNIKPYSFIDHSSEIIDDLQKDSSIYRVHRFFTSPAIADDFPFVPHSNMVFGFDITGAYSPFVLKDYLRILSSLGDVDDSQRLLAPDWDHLESSRMLLDFLNVKYIVTDRKMEGLGFHLLRQEGPHYLYQNQQMLARAYFVSKFELLPPGEFSKIMHSYGFAPFRKVYLDADKMTSETPAELEYFVPAENMVESHSRTSFEINVPSRGFAVLSDLYYPGWKVRLNGEPATVLKANGMFRAVKIPAAGKFKIDFYYEPTWRNWVWLGGIGSLLCLLIPLGFQSKQKTVRRAVEVEV